MKWMGTLGGDAVMAAAPVSGAGAGDALPTRCGATYSELHDGLKMGSPSADTVGAGS